MPTIAEATIDLHANIARLRQDLARGTAEINKFQRGITAGFQSLQRTLGALGIGATVGQLGRMVIQGVQAADAIGELAQQVGIGTDALQALGAAATANGASTDELANGVAFLTRKIADAAGGSRAAQAEFARLGIAYAGAGGEARDTEAVIDDVIRRLNKSTTASDRAAIASGAFGDRIGQRLIPALLGAEDGLQGLVEWGRENGLVMDEEGIAKAAELAAQYDLLTLKANLYWQELSVGVAGAGADFLQWLKESDAALQDWMNERGLPSSHTLPGLGEIISNIFGDGDNGDGVQIGSHGQHPEVEPDGSGGGGTGGGDTGGGGGGGTGGRRSSHVASTREQTSALQELLEEMQREATLAAATAEERERLQTMYAANTAAQRDYDAGLRDSPLLNGEELAALDAKVDFLRQIQEEHEKARKALEDEASAAEELRDRYSELNETFDSLADGLAELISGTGDWRDVLQSLLSEVMDFELTQKEGGLSLGGGILDILGSILPGSIFGGGLDFFAEGGRIGAGEVGIVGERGPEFAFGPATIVPQGGMGGPVFNIDARGADKEGLRRLERMILALNGSIEKRAVAATLDAKRRGGTFAAAFGGLG